MLDSDLAKGIRVRLGGIRADAGDGAAADGAAADGESNRAHEMTQIRMVRARGGSTSVLDGDEESLVISRSSIEYRFKLYDRAMFRTAKEWTYRSNGARFANHFSKVCDQLALLFERAGDHGASGLDYTLIIVTFGDGSTMQRSFNRKTVELEGFLSLVDEMVPGLEHRPLVLSVLRTS